jgi:hypothetical protein
MIRPGRYRLIVATCQRAAIVTRSVGIVARPDRAGGNRDQFRDDPPAQAVI